VDSNPINSFNAASLIPIVKVFNWFSTKVPSTVIYGPVLVIAVFVSVSIYSGISGIEPSS
jgi:hypothetical protein